MALYNITTRKDFEEKVLQSSKIVLVDFWANWCPPCVAMTPHLHTASEELDGTVDIVKINIEENPENLENRQIAAEFGVQSIPNMPIFIDGKEAQRLIGFTSKPQLIELLTSLSKGKE